MRAEFLDSSADAFSPAEVLGDTRTQDALAADDLQRELNDIRNEILNHADLHAVNGNHCKIDSAANDIDADLSVDLLSNSDFHPDFSSDPTSGDHDDFFGLLSGDSNRTDDNSQTAMDIGEDPPERMTMTPLTNGDILDHTRTGFEDMDDLSLPSFQEDMIQERPCEFDLKEFGIDLSSNMTVDGDAYDYMDTELIPNLFGRDTCPSATRCWAPCCPGRRLGPRANTIRGIASSTTPPDLRHAETSLPTPGPCSRTNATPQSTYHALPRLHPPHAVANASLISVDQIYPT